MGPSSGGDRWDPGRASNTSEHRDALLQLLGEQIPAIVWTTDAELRVTTSMGRALSDVGLDRESLVGLELSEVIPTDDPRNGMLVAHRRALGGESSTFEAEWRGRRFRSHIDPLREGDRIIGVIGLSIDITERRQLEEQLLRSQKMEALGRLAGGIAHDFNNLLTAVMANCDLLLDDPDVRGEALGAVQEIAETAQLGSDLVVQLLDFSRQRRSNPLEIDLSELVASTHGILRRVVGRGIDLRCSLSASPLPVLVDPAQMTQVLLNLVVNASEAMPDGGEVRLETGLLADVAGGGEFAMLTVADSGIGMDEETQRRVFEPFFTTKERTAASGAGIGMSIVYGVVTQAGGEVKFDSRPGHGTKVVIQLPLASSSRGRVITLDGSQEGERGTVLVVEDDARVRRVTSRMLQRLGYQVVCAEDGPHALRVAGEVPIDFLLTDMVMPGMSGRDLAAVLLARIPHLRVLYMSGYTEMLADVADAPFLPKPFNRDALDRKLRSLTA